MKSQHKKPLLRLPFFISAAAAMLFVGILSIFIFVEKANLNEYYLYLTEERKVANFAFSDLSDEWTESTVRTRLLGFPFSCENARITLGTDRVCAADVKSHNGVPAMFISFFFASGHLREVAVNIPFWAGGEARDSLVATLGQPASVERFPYQGVRLVGWHLKNGAAVFVNRDAPIMPPYRNSIFWRSPLACKERDCFLMP